MTYTPTVWVDDTGAGNGTVLTAARLNNMESGIVGAGISEGAVQPGVLSATDCTTPVTQPSLIRISAGVVYVRAADGTLVRTTPAQTTLPDVGVSVAGANRLDQVVVDTAGVISRLVGTVESSTVSLVNRTGFAAVPPGKQLLHDALVQYGLTGASYRDRRPWARGAKRIVPRNGASITRTGAGLVPPTAAADSAAYKHRLETMGGVVLVRWTTKISLNTAAGTQVIVGLAIDGTVAGADDHVFTFSTTVVTPMTFEWAVTPAAGSHTYEIFWDTGGGWVITSADPSVLSIIEQVGQNANNGTS